MVEARYSASHSPRPPCTPPAWHPSATFRAAGLLACGSSSGSLPSRLEPVAYARTKLTAYSCGGSHRIGLEARTIFPFHLLAKALRVIDLSHETGARTTRMHPRHREFRKHKLRHRSFWATIEYRGYVVELDAWKSIPAKHQSTINDQVLPFYSVRPWRGEKQNGPLPV